MVQDILDSGGIAPHILNLSGEIYVPADPQFEKRIGGPQSWFGLYEEKKNVHHFRESKPNYSVVNPVV
jgi:hypothetical protein